MSLRVFKIRPDFSFQTFFTSDPNGPDSDAESFELGKEPLLANWTPPPLFEDTEKRAIGNFAHCWNGGFIVDERTVNSLGHIFRDGCELLPLKRHRGKKHYLLNVLNRIDCLDRERTKWKIGRSGKSFGTIEEYQFAPGRFTHSTLFQVPKQVALLALTGTEDPQMEFKTSVESLGLTGLKFEEIWSQDGCAIKARGLSDILHEEAQKRAH